MDLTINHNHGFLTLKDVDIEPYTYNGRTWHRATGVVVAGGETSRLFHATKYSAYPVGERMTWDLFGRAGRIRNGVIDMHTCG